MYLSKTFVSFNRVEVFSLERVEILIVSDEILVEFLFDCNWQSLFVAGADLVFVAAHVVVAF